MKGIALLGVILASLAASACASATHSIDTEEMSPTYSGRTYSDLLIVAAYDNRPFRVGSETAFVEELKARGVTATESYLSIPDLHALEDENAMRQALASTSPDAILAVATLDEGYDYEYGDYLETRGIVYLLGGQPGAGTDMGSFISWAGSGSYNLYVGLWDAATLSPVWQITTDSQTTGSESGDTSALADFVVETLREKGLL